MMKKVLNSTIGILQGLTSKVVDIKNKSDVMMNQQQYELLNNRIDQIMLLINHTNEEVIPDPDPEHDYVITVISNDDVGGNYYDSGLTEQSQSIYVHENGKYYILHIGDYWRLMAVESYNDDFVWFDQIYQYEYKQIFGQTQYGRLVAPYGFIFQYKYQVTGFGDCEGRYYESWNIYNEKPVYIQQHQAMKDTYKLIKWNGNYWVITTRSGDIMAHSAGSAISGDWVDEFGDVFITIVEI